MAVRRRGRGGRQATPLQSNPVSFLIARHTVQGSRCPLALLCYAGLCPAVPPSSGSTGPLLPTGSTTGPHAQASGASCFPILGVAYNIVPRRDQQRAVV